MSNCFLLKLASKDLQKDLREDPIESKSNDWFQNIQEAHGVLFCFVFFLLLLLFVFLSSFQYKRGHSHQKCWKERKQWVRWSHTETNRWHILVLCQNLYLQMKPVACRRPKRVVSSSSCSTQLLQSKIHLQALRTLNSACSKNFPDEALLMFSL